MDFGSLPTTGTDAGAGTPEARLDITDTLPLVSYILITTFTPGPNNVSCAAAGLKLGLRRSLPYMAGISTGFFLVLVASGLFSVFLRTRYAAIAPWLKWFGFAYMLWLAASPFLKSHGGSAKEISYTYPYGLALQMVNPKSILYGITLYASFFDAIAGNVAGVLVSALVLTVVGFSSILSWNLAGTALTRLMKGGRGARAFDALMAVLLVYTAFSIVSH